MTDAIGPGNFRLPERSQQTGKTTIQRALIRAVYGGVPLDVNSLVTGVVKNLDNQGLVDDLTLFMLDLTDATIGDDNLRKSYEAVADLLPADWPKEKNPRELLALYTESGESALEALLKKLEAGEEGVLPVVKRDPRPLVFDRYAQEEALYEQYAKAFLQSMMPWEAGFFDKIQTMGDMRLRGAIVKELVREGWSYEVLEDLDSYGITDEAEKIALAHILAETVGVDCCAALAQLNIADKGELAKIVKSLAGIDGTAVAQYIGRYGFTDQAVLDEIALLSAEHCSPGFSSLVHHFGVKDPQLLIRMARLAITKKDQVPLYIQNYGLTREEDLITIAKAAASMDGGQLATHIRNFGIRDQKVLEEIALSICLNNNDIDLAYFGLTEEAVLRIGREIVSRSGQFSSKNFACLTTQEAKAEIARLIAKRQGSGAQYLLRGSGLSDQSLLRDVIKIALKSSPFARTTGWGLTDPVLCHEVQCYAYLLKISRDDFEGLEDFVSGMRGALPPPWEDLLAKQTSLRSVLIKRLFMEYAMITPGQKPGAVLTRIIDYRNTVLAASMLEKFCEAGSLDRYKELVTAVHLTLPMIFFAAWGGKKESSFYKFLLKERDNLRNALVGYMQLVLKTLDVLDQMTLLDAEKLAIVEGCCHDEPYRQLGLVQALANLGVLPKPGDLTAQVIAVLEGTRMLSLSGVKDFDKNFLATFGAIRVPNALVIYASQLKSFPALSPCLTKFVVSVLEGTFGAVRYEPTSHLALIDPKLLGAWQKSPEPVPIRDILADAPRDFSFEETLCLKFADGHAGTRYPVLAAYLRKEPSEGIPTPFEEECLKLCQNWPSQPILALQRLLSLVEPEIELHNDLKGLILSFQGGVYEGLVVVDTDNFEDLFLCGTEVADSCQRIDGNPVFNRCLLAYILDGKNRLIAVKDKTGKIVARAILRLLLDDSTSMPALFMERIYPAACPSAFVDALKEAARRRAVSLGCPVYAFGYGSTLKSFGSSVPYEYVDAAAWGVTNGTFTVKGDPL